MAFGALLKIQRILTKHNVELLWVMMASLADPRHPAFNAFWRAFRESRGGSLEDVQVGADLTEQLRDILAEYLKERER
jgi:hypothetical protein